MTNFDQQLFNDRPEYEYASYDFDHEPIAKTSGIVKKPKIAYDDTLIDSLERQHEVLVENFGTALKTGFESQDFTLLCTQLSEFKVLLQNHIIKENVKLFCYLEQQMKSNSKSLTSMRKFRKEVNYWSNALINFCKKYEQPIDVFFSQDSFKDEYQAVGKALIHRVQLVETGMYARYAPNNPM